MEHTLENIIKVAKAMHEAETNQYFRTSGDSALCHLKIAEGMFKMILIMEDKECFDEMVEEFTEHMPSEFREMGEMK